MSAFMPASQCHSPKARMWAARSSVAGRAPRPPCNLWHQRSPAVRAAPAQSLQTDEVLAHVAELQGVAAARPPRFYLPPSIGSPSLQGAALPPEFIIDGEEARHAIRVLRLQPGDRVELCDGRGAVMECTVTAADKGRNQACFSPNAPVSVVPWQGPRWTLAVGLPSKGSRADWLVEKACELGAYELIPLSTERCQYGSASRTGAGGAKRKRGGDDGSESYEPTRLERVAVAAMKQCLREHALVISPPMTVEQLVKERMPKAEVTLLAAAGGVAVHSALQNALSKSSSAGRTHEAAQLSDDAVTSEGRPRLLCVGPEGDWTPRELDLLSTAGAVPVGLGRLRLRTETAAVCLLSAAACSGL